MAIWSAEIKELEKLFESVKDQLPGPQKELGRLIKADDENMILLYSRRCLEVLVADLCECELKRARGTEPLKGIIDKLHKEKKVPSYIVTSMDHVNSMSTFGAHPKDFDPQQVKPVLVNLAIIIKWYLKYKGIQVAGKAEQENELYTGQVKYVPDNIGRKQKNILVLIIAGIFIIAAIIIFPKLFKRGRLEKLRSSEERITVAVMPFLNMTNDTTWNVWQDGIQDMLVNSLSNSEELKVRQTESINSVIQSKGLINYSSITPAFASTISQKLDANVFIYGNIKQAGPLIRIYAQLIDANTEEVLKSFQIEGPSDEKEIFQLIDELSLVVKNFLIVSGLEKVDSHEAQELVSTNSPDSYRYFIYGNKSFSNRDYSTARNWYLQALTVDSNLTIAAIYISVSYANQGLYEQGKKWCLRVYEKSDFMPLKLKIITNWLYALYFETPYEEIKYLKQSLEMDDQRALEYSILGASYNELYLYDKSIPEFEKSLKLYDKWSSKPAWVYNYTSLGYAYHKTGLYKKEKKLYERAEQDFPDDPDLIRRQSILALSKGKTDAANEYVDKYIAIRKDNSASEADLASSLGSIYRDAEILDKAEEYYRQAVSLEPDNPERMNTLAYFLIDKDRDINLGKELIEKALNLKPDDYNYMHTKGLGLLHQGKYQEAFEILQKSWDLRMKNSIYDHEAFLHLEAAKKAVAGQM